MISFQKVSKIYEGQNGQRCAALADVTLHIKPKEFISLAGQSGAGKTTLLRLLLSEEKPTSGKVFFRKQESVFN